MTRPYITNPQKELEEIIRVNLAGEYAAKVIYQKQVQKYPELQTVFEEELEHFLFFKKKLLDSNFRPSLLHPLWHFLSAFLGNITTFLGKSYVMTATDAVEDVIQEHYQKQIEILKFIDPELMNIIEKFRDQEIKHQKDAQRYKSHPFLKNLIKYGCKLSIEIAKKV